MKPLFVVLWACSLLAADRFGAGTLLIADKKLDDPKFRRTVLVIARHSSEGTLGLVLNRRSAMPLGEVLESWKEAAGVKDPIYEGGPVGRTGMFALLRMKIPPAAAERVIDDVQLITDRARLAPHLAGGPAHVRVYAGYAGWSAEQLESEISDGAWHVLPGSPKLIFDDEPETLWQRLSHAAEMNVAQRGRYRRMGYTESLNSWTASKPHSVRLEWWNGLQ